MSHNWVLGTALGGASALALAAVPRPRGNKPSPLTGLLISVGVATVTMGFYALAASRAKDRHERLVASGAASGTARNTAIGVGASALLGLL